MAHAARTASVRSRHVLRSLLAGASAAAVALGGLLLAPAPAAQAASTIDQQNPRSAVDFVFDATVPFEETQTFTAGRSGLLDAVDFDVYEIAAPGTTITATLSAVGGSAPIAGSGSAQVLSTGWLHIPISQPPTVLAGSTYMVTFTGSGSGIVRFSTNENYPGGISGAGDDLVFRTYVQAGTAPSVSGTLPRATAGQPYAAGFVLQGSPTPTVRLWPGTSLPPGLTLSPSGVVSGTPTAAGTFDFAVDATNAFGAHSIAASIRVDPTVPGMVQDLAVGQQGDQMVLTWSAPRDTGGLPLSYRVRVGDRDWQTTDATSLVFDLAPGSRVDVTVLAINDFGFGAPSVVQATRITEPATPAAPTVEIVGPGSVRVTWVEPAMNGGTSRGYWVLTPNGTRFVSGLSIELDVPLGTVQEFRVSALNEVGQSAYSEPSSVYVPEAPRAPSGLSSFTSSDSVRLDWNAPFDPYGTPVQQYVVERLVGGVWVQHATLPGDRVGTYVTGLPLGEVSQLRVRAQNISGLGAPSGTVSVQPMRQPDAPTGLETQVGDGTIDVAWMAPAEDGGSAITSYVVQYRVGTDAWIDLPESEIDGTYAWIMDLANGVEVQVRVAARNGLGLGAFATVTATPRAVPGEPIGVVAVGGDRSIALTWAAPLYDGGADVFGYLVQQRIAGGEWTDVSSVAGTELALDDIANGTRVQLRVAATNEVGTGPWSTVVTAVPHTLAAAPDWQTVAPHEGGAVLSWTVPDGGGLPIDWYIVELRASGGEWMVFDRVPGYLPWTFLSSLVDGVTYEVRVHAVTGGGDGALSAVESFTPRRAPDAPTDLVAVPGDGSVTLSWVLGDDGGAPVTSVVVERRIDGGDWTAVDGVDDTQVVLTGLANGSTVELRVAAANDAGRGAWSAIATATPHTIAAAPTWIIIGPHAGGAFLSWTVPGDGGLPVDEFVVEVRAPGGDWEVVDVAPATRPSSLIFGLADGVVHEVRVHAVTAAGDGVPSAIESFTPRRVPDAPTSVVATPGSGSADVTWAAPAFDGGAPIGGYLVEHRAVGETAWTMLDPITAQSATIAPLDDGTAYEVRVTAFNAAGRGFWSDVVTVTPRSVPDAPTGVSALPASQSILVEWSAPAWDGGDDVTGYLVELHRLGDVDEDGAPRWTAPASVDVDGTTAVVSGLVDGQPYDVRVAAVNAAGTGPWSGYASTTPRSVPGAPATLAAAAGAGAVALTWTPPATDGGAPIQSWIVEHRVAGAQAWATPAGLEQASSTGVVVTGLADGTTYDFRVAAANVAGTGAWSEVVTATPSRVPDAVTGLEATAGDGIVTLRWDAPAFDGGSPIVEHAVTATIDGVDVPVDVVVDGTSAIVSGLQNGVPVTLSVAAVNANGAGTAVSVVATPFRFAPTLLGPGGAALAGSTLRAGDVVEIRASGLPAGAIAVVELHSTPIELGRGAVDADGVLAMSVTIPGGVEPGAHEIVVRLEAADADAPISRTPITIAGPIVTPPVVDPPAVTPPVAPVPAAPAPTGGAQASGGSDALPRTGVELLLLPMLLAGAALVLGGAAVRRRATTRRATAR